MGLKSAIAAAVNTAFDAVSDLSASTVIFRKYHSGPGSNNFTSVADPDTGGAFVAESYTDATLSRFVLTSYSAQELASGVAGATDLKLMFPQSEISGITPDTNDEVIIDGKRYIINDGSAGGETIKADPAGATWTVRISLP